MSDICYLSLVLFSDLLKLFTTSEIMRWTDLCVQFQQHLRAAAPGNAIFNPKSEDGEKRWKDLNKRMVEHVSIY